MMSTLSNTGLRVHDSSSSDDQKFLELSLNNNVAKLNVGTTFTLETYNDESYIKTNDDDSGTLRDFYAASEAPGGSGDQPQSEAVQKLNVIDTKVQRVSSSDDTITGFKFSAANLPDGVKSSDELYVDLGAVVAILVKAVQEITNPATDPATDPGTDPGTDP